MSLSSNNHFLFFFFEKIAFSFGLDAFSSPRARTGCVEPPAQQPALLSGESEKECVSPCTFTPESSSFSELTF